MIKRRIKIPFSARGGLLFILLLTAAMSGCKKEAPPPPPQATPLPAKTEQGAPQKPVQSAVSSAKGNAAKSPGQNPVQKQLSTSKQASQKQISSSRLRVLPVAPSLDFSGKRDPFKPFAQMPAQQPLLQKSAKIQTRDPLPIQSFDTEKFRVSGIVTGLKENSALVIDPKGKGYVVRAGMPIGNNDGYVKNITDSTVTVEESFRDDNGRVRKRLVKLTLLRKK